MAEDEGALFARAEALEERAEALAIEAERLRAEIRLREESQIPVIPRGAQAKIERLEGEVERLREALEPFALLSDVIGDEVPEYMLVYYYSPDRVREAFDNFRRARAALVADDAGGGPDPGSFGGHPYTPDEIALGYGTEHDPRFTGDGE